MGIDGRTDPRQTRAWLVSGLGVVVLAALLCVNASSDPDLGFHVATGRAVIAAGAIPSTNVLTFAEPEHPWITQQWLPATLLSLLFDRAGFAGTMLFRGVLVALTAALSMASAWRLTDGPGAGPASPAIAASVIALGAWASALRFVERPLLVTNAALAFVLFACASASVTKDRRWLVVAGLAASGAIHLHAGAIFSLIALAVLGLSCALEPIAARAMGRPPEATPREGLALALAALVALGLAAGTLALYHPFGIEVLAVPLRMEADPYLAQHLVEFRPAWDQPLRVMAPYAVFVIAVVAIALASLRRAPLPWLAMIALGVVISLRHARFVDLAWIAASPPAAALVVRHARLPRPRAVALAIGIASMALLDRSSIAPMTIGGAPAVWPDPLFSTIRRERLVGPVFVQDGWAGPFLARFWPEERVFFHPAFEAYSPPHYRLYQSIRYGEDGWREALDRFGVELVLLRYTSPRERELQGGRPNLRQRLAARTDWALVALDELGEIFARRDGPNAAAARGCPSGVDPDRLAFTGPPRAARAGLERLARRGPASIPLAVMLAVARADDGDREGAAAVLDAAGSDPRVALARQAIARLPR